VHVIKRNITYRYLETARSVEFNYHPPCCHSNKHSQSYNVSTYELYQHTTSRRSTGPSSSRQYVQDMRP